LPISEVRTVSAEPVGTGQIGACFRLTLTGAGVPASLVAKLPAADPAARALLGGAYRATTVDWQTLTVGLPARDLSYFLATSLTTEDRRAHEHRLVARYHEGLLSHGVTGYPLDLCWDDYRFALLQGPLITVLGCAYGTPTERGDAMFLTMAARACAALRDLDPRY